MERGSPIIASNTSSLPEVVGDAGIVLSPHDPAAWAESMRNLIDYPEMCALHRTRGFAQAQRFSWKQNASTVIATWQRLLSEERADLRRANEICSIPLTPPN
jgi:glycosyltransferase involved in cell wall biosynthesis